MQRKYNKRRKRNKMKFFSIISILVIIISCIFVTQSFLNRNEKSNLAVQASKENEEKQKAEEQKIEEQKKLEEEKKTSNVNEEGAKFSVDVHEVRKILDGQAEKDGKKIAFLTFDDGPSTTVTPKILDTLNKCQVKATFFLVGNAVDNEKHKDLVKRIYNEGNAIGNHTYTHDYKKIYPNNSVNVETFFQEVDKTNNSIKNILGNKFHTRVIRMPGGYMSRKYYKDPNIQAFNNKLAELDMNSIDWNALSGDAEGKKRNANGLFERAKATISGNDKVIILMHDTYGKESTAEALPQIIEWLKSQGYEFKIMS